MNMASLCKFTRALGPLGSGGIIFIKPSGADKIQSLENSVIKKVLRQKTSKQNPEGSRRENRKNEKQIVAASYATRISAANQVTQLESKPRSKPQIKVDAKLPATNYYGRKNLSGYQPQLFRAQREIVVLMPRRCAGWDARLTDATKLCDSAR